MVIIYISRLRHERGDNRTIFKIPAALKNFHRFSNWVDFFVAVAAAEFY